MYNISSGKCCGKQNKMGVARLKKGGGSYSSSFTILCWSKKASLIRWPQGNKHCPMISGRSKYSKLNQLVSRKEMRNSQEPYRNFAFTLGWMGRFWAEEWRRSEAGGPLRRLMPFPGERWWLLCSSGQE